MALLIALSANATEKLIIVNEGIWQTNNGRLSYFEDGKIVNDKCWFREVNGYDLGDTPNDIIQINDNLIAIAINYSNIVQFITPEGKAVAATEDIPNNRRLASDGKYVYITSYGHECKTVTGTVTFTKGFVAKIDVSTFKVVATCEVGYEPEGIAIYRDHLFIANTGGYKGDHDYETTVSIVDANTMQKVKDVDTGQINLYGTMSRNGRYLCINSPGDYYEGVMAATIIFDCEAALNGNDDCFTKLDYASTYNCVNADGDFFAIGASYSYITNVTTFNYITIDPEEVMETNGASGVTEDMLGTMVSDIEKFSSPYGIYVNPYTGYIYATDAGEFVSAGSLYQWTPDGKLVGKYKIYINPGHFLALPPDGHFNAVNDITADTSAATDSRIFNLQGMRVTNPVPGQIYIQNGKKFIQR
jgi:DNA-binding beta-propeller fold protein YncE